MPWTRNLGSALLIVLLPCSAEAQTCSGSVHWQIYETPCLSVPAGVERVDAVGYGHLYFSPSPFTPGLCGNFKDGGFESLDIYQDQFGEYSNWPCMSQNCSTDLFDISGHEQPWIAIVDPAPAHADVVAALIAEAASADVEPVIALIDERLQPASFGHACIDDLDLLAELFDVTTVVATRAPKLVGINMSFGRKALPDDADTTACSGTLSCQVGKVLAHLMFPGQPSQPKVVAVASSGNTAQNSFPSQLKHVIAAGAADLTILSASGDAVPSAETPELGQKPRALMPASGLCLEDDHGESWVVPSGSSNSAAIMTAWAASALLHDEATVEPLLSQPELWHPEEICASGDCTYALALASTLVPAPGAGAGEVVVRALSDDLGQCGAWDKDDIQLELTFEPWPVDPRDQYPTTLDILAALQPMPGVVLCAPCSLEEPDRGPGSLLAPPAAAGSAPTKKAPSRNAATKIAWRLDLHGTLKLSGQKKHLELYLRLGKDIFRLRDFQGDLTLDQLRAITEGRVSALYLSGKIDPSQLYDQPSLISVLEVPLNGGSTEIIHHSVPIVPQ